MVLKLVKKISQRDINSSPIFREQEGKFEQCHCADRKSFSPSICFAQNTFLITAQLPRFNEPAKNSVGIQKETWIQS